MIDVRLLRTEPDAVRSALARRRQPEVLDQLERAIAFDTLSRDIVAKRDAIRAEVNDLSKEVGAAPPRAATPPGAEELQLRVAPSASTSGCWPASSTSSRATCATCCCASRTCPHPDAPDGAGDVDNPVVKGPVNLPAEFPEHQRVPHWETGTALGILDNERATKISGAMFTMQRGHGATLARALCQLALDRNADEFEEIRPPSLVTTATLTATGQLPKFADDAYNIERDDLWCIPTAEVPLTSIYAGEILDEPTCRCGSWPTRRATGARRARPGATRGACCAPTSSTRSRSSPTPRPSRRPGCSTR